MKRMMRQIVFETPIGYIRVTEKEGKITGICCAQQEERKEEPQEACEILLQAQNQILDYLNGKSREIRLPYTLSLPPFSKRVLESLQKIPYGSFCTYAQWAKTLNSPGAARAVGNALHRNPLLLLLPCHRILGAGNALGGFAAGTQIKQKLLDLEGIPYHT